MKLQSMISLLKSLFLKFNPVLYDFLPLSLSAHTLSEILGMWVEWVSVMWGKQIVTCSDDREE